MTPPAIHITGASGAGVSTLGLALAKRLGAAHLDTDNFYWLPVEPHYSAKRPIPERLAMLECAFAENPHGWILSGSIGDWGVPLVPRFSHVVFVSTPTDIRLERLQAREAARYGAAILPGGALHVNHEAFIAWASEYDGGTEYGRNRATHEKFLATLTCPVIRLDGAQPTDALADQIIKQIVIPDA
jgi:adenylate kinase family enzyme